MAGLMDLELLRKFQELVYVRSDLYFPPGKQVFFENQLSKKLTSEGFDNYESYYGSLLSDPEMLGRFVQGLTTNQTSFFRNPAQFRALQQNVFPELIERKNREVISSWGGGNTDWRPGRRHPSMSIKAWSAGCSTGEEAYSIAFALLETLKFPKAWDIDIIGTDIKKSALSVARRGVYEKDAAGEIDARLKGKYMENSGAAWAVREHPSSLVKFFEANLKEFSGGMSDHIMLRKEQGQEHMLYVKGYFDVIFCRNVMIYFDREAQQRLVDAIYGCLRPGGYLFTGDSEPLHLFRHSFDVAGDNEALYYQKPHFKE